MATITIIGLGYIGLPTAAMFATHGHTVHGFDVNKRVVEKLKNGEIHIEEPGLLAFVRDAIHSGRFVPTDTMMPADVYIVCVPTPFHKETKKADLSYVESATRSIVPHLKKGDLVILESTVPARTTEDVMMPILAESGLEPRTDLLVAHCPETVLPGNMIHELAHNHRVVGGVTPEATQAAEELYATFVKAEIIPTDATTAEFVKLIENTYRDVNIALANELAMVSRRLGIKSREAIRIANMHPRVNIHHPGPGVGGHCIPVDPWFVVEQAPEARLVRMARDVNDTQPDYVVALVEEMLAGVETPRIAMLGLAYKGNVDDTRESPSFEIVHKLRAKWGAESVMLVDPHVLPELHAVMELDQALEGADLVLIATDHNEFRTIAPEYAAKLVKGRRLVDTRGVVDADSWRAAGFDVEAI